MRLWFESTAGMVAQFGRQNPSTSATLVMVEAVPMVMQAPGEREMPFSISRQAHSVMLPARNSCQYFQTSEPEPTVLPCQLPRNIGPAGMKIPGRFIVIQPRLHAGVR